MSARVEQEEGDTYAPDFEDWSKLKEGESEGNNSSSSKDGEGGVGSKASTGQNEQLLLSSRPPNSLARHDSVETELDFQQDVPESDSMANWSDANSA